MIPDERDAARRTYNQINCRLTIGGGKDPPKDGDAERSICGKGRRPSPYPFEQRKSGFTVGKHRNYVQYDFGTLELVGRHLHWYSSFTGDSTPNLPLDEAWERVSEALNMWRAQKSPAPGPDVSTPVRDEQFRVCERCKEEERDTREAPSTARKRTEVTTDKSGPIGEAAKELWRKHARETGGRVVDDAPSEWFIPDGKSKVISPPQYRNLRLGRLMRQDWLDEDEYREEEAG